MTDQPETTEDHVYSEAPTPGGLTVGTPEPAPVPEPELSPKERAEQAIQFLENWHQSDDRFRNRIDAVKAYIADLENAPKAGVANIQPGPELIPQDVADEEPTPHFGSKGKSKR